MLRLTILAALAVASNLSPPLRAAEDAGSITGRWTAEIENFKTVWDVSQTNGKWRVAASYYDKKGKAHGGFEGKDYKFEDGKLVFTQVWTKKPHKDWHDNSTVTLKLDGADTLKETWKNGEHHGGHDLSRIKK